MTSERGSSDFGHSDGAMGGGDADFLANVERRLARACLEEHELSSLMESLERTLQVADELLARRDGEVNALLNYVVDVACAAFRRQSSGPDKPD
jgi:predicted kinase